MGAEQTKLGEEAGVEPELPGGVEQLAAIVAARNEAERIADTVVALRGAFPAAAIWVADDASTDGTAEAAIAAGAQVVSRGRPHGKGANVTRRRGGGAERQPTAHPHPFMRRRPRAFRRPARPSARGRPRR